MVNSRKREEKMWSDVVSRLLLNTVSHPIEYAKVLIQIGHEPILPRETRTLILRKPALSLPNIFQYVRYIKACDGFTGCYRGLVPKICAYTINGVVMDKISDSYLFTEVFPQVQDDDEHIEELPDEKRKAAYIREFLKDSICKVAGIVACHPLDVIAIRMMAQFVGGLVPRLIANVSTIALVSYSTYLINKYLVHDRESMSYVSALMTLLSTTVTYPFLVVYNCMAVTNSGLAAGEPPHMPIYSSWVDCWRHLSMTNQLKRGSSLLWRYYTGPAAVINGKLVVLNKTHYYTLD
ncbi:Similar to MTCH2: Mitochondrial carrier homolog 2 (Pongo abelii) [Cotesia congregata]|uniref:Similar to MTCH2: Mitochondrial carrier homolog 2 (Pongo abelii) n=1 Tax=Cotesia congregata TaxID=51543 RepID=A0A8J2MGQ5_COTCN|nr:Similar to MTCH2: Mitochondrial carrier homolog 2 (Pongo abelii) [Cotesia congregata]